MQQRDATLLQRLMCIGRSVPLKGVVMALLALRTHIEFKAFAALLAGKAGSITSLFWRASDPYHFRGATVGALWKCERHERAHNCVLASPVARHPEEAKGVEPFLGALLVLLEEMSRHGLRHRNVVLPLIIERPPEPSHVSWRLHLRHVCAHGRGRVYQRDAEQGWVERQWELLGIARLYLKCAAASYRRKQS